MEEVTEDKLQEFIQIFQKYKIPSSDVWTIDFFVGLYDIIGKDIREVVEEYRLNGQIHAPLNATFIDLIPKKDDQQSLEYFKSISLCNNIYKVVEKLISRIIKAMFFKSIS